MSPSPPQSAKFLEARDGLPEEFRSIYEEMVTHYAWYTAKKFGRGYVAYALWADEMVRAG